MTFYLQDLNFSCSNGRSSHDFQLFPLRVDFSRCHISIEVINVSLPCLYNEWLFGFRFLILVHMVVFFFFCVCVLNLLLFLFRTFTSFLLFFSFLHVFLLRFLTLLLLCSASNTLKMFWSSFELFILKYSKGSRTWYVAFGFIFTHVLQLNHS